MDWQRLVYWVVRALCGWRREHWYLVMSTLEGDAGRHFVNGVELPAGIYSQGPGAWNRWIEDSGNGDNS